MFVKKSTYEKDLKRLRDDYEGVLNLERDNASRVQSILQAQIEDLRKLVFTPEPTAIETLPIREANAVLDGVEVMPKEAAEYDQEIREFNRLMSGNYDRSEDMYS